jgi:hypothetical protein
VKPFYELTEEERAEWELEYAKMKEYHAKGHTHHCACRIVWGDGECECRKSNEKGMKDDRGRSER